MTEPVEKDDEFTEIVDATIPRVDLVGKGANGLPFLIAKTDGTGLIPADAVEALLKSSTDKDETVSLTGTPAAIAATIHAAAQRHREADISKGSDQEDAVTDSTDVSKADAESPVEAADLIPAAPPGSTAESIPGSPDWEQMDAQTAEAAISVLGRAKAAVEWLATREVTEGVTGDDVGDMDNAFCLEDACCAIDCAIRTLGAFAAGEKLEAELGPELEALTKTVAAAAAPLTDLEALAPIVKAGRVLSSANEARIKSASDALAEVLATLPAPIDDGQVAKSETKEAAVADDIEKAADAVATMTDAQAADAATEALVKAKGDPLVICYNSSGKAIGLIDPEKLMPIADDAPAAPAASDADSGSGDPDPAPAAAPADAEVAAPAPAAAPADDTNPAPADTAGAPNDQADDDDVTKTTQTPVDDLVKAALQDYRSEMEQVVKALRDEIDDLRAEAPPRAVVNAHAKPILRGQDKGAVQVDVEKAAEERQAFDRATTVEQREAHANRMNEAASAYLAALHAAR